MSVRHKNEIWDLGTRLGIPDADVHTALLMDIRDELQSLGRLLGANGYNGLKLLVRMDKRLRNEFKHRKAKVGLA